jgi:hypothetical protein
MTPREQLERDLEAIQPPPPPVATVGRIVHFYPQSYVLGAPLGQPQAAIVTFVHNIAIPGSVAIEVFGHDEKVRHRGVPFSPTPKPGHWSWPPR